MARILALKPVAIGLLTVALLAAVIAAIIWQTLARDEAYYQRRDLRALARTGQEINNSAAGLSAAAAIHFNPDSMTFSLDPDGRCLVGTVKVLVGRAGEMQIDYRFVDPNRMRKWLARLAEEDDAPLTRPLDPKSPPQADARALKTPEARFPDTRRCSLAHPRGGASDASMALGDAISIGEDIPVDRLVQRSVRPLMPGETGPAPAALVQQILTARAVAMLGGDRPATPGEGQDDRAAIVAASLKSAFGSNAIHIDATLSNPDIGSQALAADFRAIRLLRPAAASGAPELIWQSGEIPPLLAHDRLDAADRVLLGLISAGGASAPRPVVSDPVAAAGPSVSRIGNLIVYQRDYVGPPGLGCLLRAPCKLVGVREASGFDRQVRRINGIQATWLLIGVMTVIGLIPLVQLTLSRRLDPLGPAGQWLVWLSLIMLAGNAAVAVLAILQSSAAGIEAKAAAREEALRFRAAFAWELAESVPKLARIGRQLACRPPDPGHVRFPAPADLPLTPEEAFRTTMRGFLPETVLLFDRRTGAMSADRMRWNRLQEPAFAASVADRAYFRAAQQDKFHQLMAAPAEAGARGERFTIEQLFSKPDGLRKTVIATPADCAGQPARIAVATGYLRTFRKIRPQTGFRFAVVDGGVRDAPDVLFHSDRRSELVDRFVDDVDDPGAVRAALRAPDGAAPIATYYRAQPARLHFARLYDDLDWVLVLIEDQNQAGYAIWRNALASYLILFAIMTAALGLAMLGRGRHPGLLDRRPLMWLWPRATLSGWTPQYREDAAEAAALAACARPRAIRASTALLFLAAIPIAPGWSRLFMAFATVALACSARAAFDGLLGSDRVAARIGDRWVARIGAICALLAAAAALLPSLGGLGRLGALGGPGPALRVAITVGLAIAAAAVLRHPPGAAPGAASRPIATIARWWRRRLSAMLPRSPAPRRAPMLLPSWLILIGVIGTAPVLAGFLDSGAANHVWAVQAEQRNRCVFGNDDGDRLADINRTLVAAARFAVPAKRRCSIMRLGPPQGWVDGGVRWLGLDRATRQASQAIPVRWRLPTFAALLRCAVPIGTFVLLMMLFRRQFFPPAPPRVLPARGLTCDGLVDSITARAAMARRASAARIPDPPIAPFAYSACKRHLIVGPDLFQSDDSAFHRSPDVLLFDLLRDDPAAVQPQAQGGIVIHNFDAAILDRRRSIAACAHLEALVALQNRADGGHLHLFLFAASEPLDRIVNVNKLRDKDPAAPPADPVEEYFWAELLQPFALYTVGQGPLAPRPDLLRQELRVARTGSVRRLERNFDPHAVDDQDLIAFVADFLAEHYRLIWQTSTSDEQVILFELARRSHLKMIDSFALRSLLLRGLVIRVPEYRLINRSFARYVLSMGTTRELRDTARAVTGATDQIWPALRIPAAALVIVGLLLLILLAPGDSGIAALVPALAAAVPAMVASWLGLRQSGGGAPLKG